MPGRLQELREAKGITMRDLARVSKVSRPTLYMAEANPDRVTIDSLVKIANALGVTLDDFAPERAAECRAALAKAAV